VLAISTVLSCNAFSEDVTPENDPQTDLEKVKVYGQKQIQNLQDTSASIGLITDEQIETSTIQDINDVFARTANISSLRGGNESVFAIRGVSIYGFTDNPASYTASVYVDETPMNITSIRYGSLGLWDIQQVESYRGPQGTLQGRNSLMGAIHLKTTDPTEEWGGKVQATAGSFDTYRLSAAGGGALNDELAIRLSADNYQSDGYVDNVTRNDDEYAGFDRSAYRAKLKYTPKAFSNTTALLTLSHHDSKIGDQPMSRMDDPFSFEALSDHESTNQVKTDTANLKVDIALSDELSITSITAFTKDSYDRVDDYDSSADALGKIDQYNESDTISQELRLSFNVGNFSGVTGIYLSQTEDNAYWVVDSKYPKAYQQQTAYTAMMAPTSMGGYGLDQATADAIWGAIPDFIDLTALNDSEYTTTNMAIFGDVNWQANDALRVTIGARYDNEKQDRDQLTDNSIQTVINSGSPAIDGSANALLGALASNSTKKSDTEYHAFLPKLSVQYFFNENLNTAFTVQQGYRAGGSSVSMVSGTIADFDPEFTTNYELSLRSQLFNGLLTANANAFYTDWKDQQVDVSLSGDSRDSVIGNAGESHLYGAELELSAYISSEIEVFTTLGYVKTEFDKFTQNVGGDLQDYKGNEFAGAPNTTASLGAIYRSHQGIFASVDANYQNESYVDNANTESRKLDDRTIINTKIGYEALDYSVFLWVTNITDEEYLVNNWEAQAGVSTQDTVQPGAPRVVGVTFASSF